MRCRLIIAALALMALLSACASGTSSTATSPASAFPEQTTTVATIDVKAQPKQLDSSGAAFAIILDTHSGSLDMDLATTSRLEVNGTTWPSAGWEGDPPTGHHREGTLRFKPGGPAGGTATLTIGGLAQPVTFTWDAKAGA